jgi:hypothetical protein
MAEYLLNGVYIKTIYLLTKRIHNNEKQIKNYGYRNSSFSYILYN